MKRYSLIIAFFIMLICFGTSTAYNLKGTSWNWVGSTPKIVSLKINPNCPDENAIYEVDVICAAFDTWNNEGANLNFDYDGSTTVEEFTENNNQNDMFWNPYYIEEYPEILALVRTWPNEGAKIEQTDVAFYDELNLWSTSGNPGAWEYDVESAALHELGHVLGLGDVFTNPDPVMYYLFEEHMTKIDLTNDDIDGLEAIYGLLVNVPNGSETWNVGTSYNITWGHDGVSGNVNILLDRNYPNNDLVTIFSNTSNDGTEGWTPTNPPSSNCRIRVESYNFSDFVYDVSDADFTIAGYTVTYPTETGIHWFIGINYTITWTSVGNPGNVNIRLNRYYPSENWGVLVYNTDNDGLFNWTVTPGESNTCRIKIENATSPNNCNISKNNFAIELPLDGLVGKFLGEINPNPFNSSTRIHYQIPTTTRVTLTIYDVTGRKVTVLEDRNMGPGEHDALWDASNMPSGIYFLHMNTRDFQDIKKLLLLK